MAGSTHAWTINRSRNNRHLPICSAITPQSLIQANLVSQLCLNLSYTVSPYSGVKAITAADALFRSGLVAHQAAPVPNHLKGLNAPQQFQQNQKIKR